MIRKNKVIPVCLRRFFLKESTNLVKWGSTLRPLVDSSRQEFKMPNLSEVHELGRVRKEFRYNGVHHTAKKLGKKSIFIIEVPDETSEWWIIKGLGCG